MDFTIKKCKTIDVQGAEKEDDPLGKERLNGYKRYTPLIWIVRKVMQHAKLPFGLMVMQHVLFAAVPVLVAFTTGKMVTILSDAEASWGDTWIWMTVLMLSYFLGGSHILNSFIDYLYLQRLQPKLDEPLLQKFATMSLKQFEHPYVHDLISRTVNPSGTVREICENLISLGGAILQILSLVIFIGLTVWWVGPLLVLILFLTAHFETKLGMRSREIERTMSVPEREKKYAGNLLSNRQAAMEFRVFGFGQWVISRWNKWVRFIQRKRLLFDLSIAWRVLIVRLPQFIALFGCILLIGWQIRETGGSIGQFTAMIVALLPLFSDVREIGDLLRDLSENNEYLRELQEAYALPEPQTASGSEDFPKPMQQGINFDEVSFTYPGKSEPVLKKVSFHIHPGERIALVGANGSGKSTLIKLLLGLYEPDSGKIFVDGIDLQNIKADRLHEEMSVVFQDFGKYMLTVKENIGLGQLDQLHDLAAVKAAAIAGDADDFIKKLPEQYETPLGKLKPKSYEPSLGQWQKIAISRALMRKAQVLIFDEPTAALDPMAESKLYKHLIDILREKTAVLVTHRLGSVHTCDKIIVLDQGTVVEIGSHQELMAKNGLYARMYTTQAEWYEEVNE